MKIIKKPESLFVTKYSNSLSFADATISVNDNKMPDDNTESEQRIPKQKINSPAKCVFFFYYHQQKATNRTPRAHTWTRRLYTEFIWITVRAPAHSRCSRTVECMVNHAHGWWCAADSTRSLKHNARSYTIAFWWMCAYACVEHAYKRASMYWFSRNQFAAIRRDVKFACFFKFTQWTRFQHPEACRDIRLWFDQLLGSWVLSRTTMAQPKFTR